MTILEAEEIALALRARSKMESQHGMPRELTLSGKAEEAIRFLLTELREAEMYSGNGFCPYCD
jgi:hypothetical protein